MKINKLLGTLVLSLLLSGNAYAKKFLKVCTYQANVYNYPLLIDLDLITLILGPFSEVNINNIEDNHIFQAPQHQRAISVLPIIDTIMN